MSKRIERAKMKINNAFYDLRMGIIDSARNADEQELEILQKMVNEVNALEKRLTRNPEVKAQLETEVGHAL